MMQAKTSIKATIEASAIERPLIKTPYGSSI